MLALSLLSPFFVYFALFWFGFYLILGSSLYHGTTHIQGESSLPRLIFLETSLKTGLEMCLPRDSKPRQTDSED